MRGSEEAVTSTRDRILSAAVALARSGEERVTVRGVAARAGVGMGTLRHHFPTQRDLLDAVFASLYQQAMPDEQIHDATVPAAERLLECLRDMLNPVGTDERARETWRQIFDAFIGPDATPDNRAGYAELHRSAIKRVESWLSILAEQGHLERGDNTARARFLVAVVNGLAVQRALPSDLAPLEVENAVLRAAIDSLPITQPPS